MAWLTTGVVAILLFIGAVFGFGYLGPNVHTAPPRSVQSPASATSSALDNCSPTRATPPPVQGFSFSTRAWSVTIPSGLKKAPVSPIPTIVEFARTLESGGTVGPSPSYDINSDALGSLSDADANVLKGLINMQTANQPSLLNKLLSDRIKNFNDSNRSGGAAYIEKTGLICVGSMEATQFIFADRSMGTTTYYVITTFADPQNVVDVTGILDSVNPNSRGFSDYQSIVASFRFD